MSEKKLNYSALSRQITSEERKRYPTQQLSPIDSYAVLPASIGFVIAGVVSAGVIIIYLVGGYFTLPVLYVVIFTLFSALVGYIYYIFNKASKKYQEKNLRVKLFTAENNLMYVTDLSGRPDYPGAPFKHPDFIGVSDTIKLNDATEIGRYTLKFDIHTKSGTNEGYESGGFMAIKLDKILPHLILDSRQNNGSVIKLKLRQLPFELQQNQVLELEGNFNDYFDLYARTDQKLDALYVFTPDVMELFMNDSYELDAEIVGNYLFIYSPTKPFDLTDGRILDCLLQIAGKLTGKLNRTSVKYNIGQNHTITTAASVYKMLSGNRIPAGKLFYLYLTITMILIVAMAVGYATYQVTRY